MQVLCRCPGLPDTISSTSVHVAVTPSRSSVYAEWESVLGRAVHTCCSLGSMKIFPGVTRGVLFTARRSCWTGERLGTVSVYIERCCELPSCRWLAMETGARGPVYMACGGAPVPQRMRQPGRPLTRRRRNSEIASLRGCQPCAVVSRQGSLRSTGR